jgi:hypothetical protein
MPPPPPQCLPIGSIEMRVIMGIDIAVVDPPRRAEKKNNSIVARAESSGDVFTL